MSTSHTFEKCPHCHCNSKGISIVLCGNSKCRKIFCSVCGGVYLSNTQDDKGTQEEETQIEGQPMAGCIHCWSVRPLIWKRQRNEPQIGRRNDKGQPVERFHTRLGEIG